MSASPEQQMAHCIDYAAHILGLPADVLHEALRRERRLMQGRADTAESPADVVEFSQLAEQFDVIL